MTNEFIYYEFTMTAAAETTYVACVTLFIRTEREHMHFETHSIVVVTR